MSSAENNKVIVQKLYEEIMNKRALNRLHEFVSEDFQGANNARGPQAFRVGIEVVLKALPDAQWNVQEVIGDGDKVLLRWKLEGTQTGSFSFFAPTGNKITNDGMGVFELENGKIVKSTVYTDRLGFLQQIDVLPADLSALTIHNDHIRFIDKFIVPASATKAFVERSIIARDFLRKLEGFIEDAAYERIDENGNLVFISIAVWKDMQSMTNAKEAVQAEYKKQGFNPAEFMQSLAITIDRGLYKRTY